MFLFSGEIKVGHVEYKANADNPSKSYCRISTYKAYRPKGIDETQLFSLRIMIFGKHAEQAGKITKGDTIYVVGELRPEWYKNKEGVIVEGLTVFADRIDAFSYREAAPKLPAGSTPDAYPFPAPASTEKKVEAAVIDDDIPF